MGKFKLYLDDLKEETTSGDIATVDTKMDLVKRSKFLEKGKKCKKHGRRNCQECEMLEEDSKWN